ncbi:MAG: hypothetical protein COU10_04080 [Candidatus Harrisonbacteria bacterium CG10_big_fil_rev_8_21_14_0_10_45_28]|uniref:AtpZ/AtpI family protein n=1 Tax=Candidatus Harrisonbacteria bacterium CG10_big_fil_rev_8_21_14_0_10_45_28 TaxID=1974586 RepID=A0A2H0UPG1_9BACT|nr:MAG: hypothetical protein COU10_04080 [Candidatus Harrisonbacteria bacterium CG10_big_fil_rev_8_21_14_0_10_45_28]
MLNMLKNFKMTWWQIAIYEIALICLGITIGATWTDLFTPWRILLLIIFVLGAGYIIAHWIEDINDN